MTGIAPKEVRVLYRDLGQVHVFTSPDLPGLHHANVDIRKAYETLPALVAELVELQFKQHEHYRLDRDFDAFQATLNSSEEMPVFSLSAEPHVAVGSHV